MPKNTFKGIKLIYVGDDMSSEARYPVRTPDDFVKMKGLLDEYESPSLPLGEVQSPEAGSRSGSKGS